MSSSPKKLSFKEFNVFQSNQDTLRERRKPIWNSHVIFVKHLFALLSSHGPWSNGSNLEKGVADKKNTTKPSFSVWLVITLFLLAWMGRTWK